jgi:hypothetical protein
MPLECLGGFHQKSLEIVKTLGTPMCIKENKILTLIPKQIFE